MLPEAAFSRPFLDFPGSSVPIFFILLFSEHNLKVLAYLGFDCFRLLFWFYSIYCVYVYRSDVGVVNVVL